jgi:hypothetical protein
MPGRIVKLMLRAEERVVPAVRTAAGSVVAGLAPAQAVEEAAAHRSLREALAGPLSARRRPGPNQAG